MEAMRTTYAKKKRDSVSTSELLKQNAAFVSQFLFVGTHFRIFVRTFLVHSYGVRVSSKASATAEEYFGQVNPYLAPMTS